MPIHGYPYISTDIRGYHLAYAKHFQAYAWQMRNIWQAYTWQMPCICQAYAWHMPCMCQAYAWHLPSMCLAFAWHMGICLECAWRQARAGPMPCTCQAYAKHMPSTCQAHARHLLSFGIGQAYAAESSIYKCIYIYIYICINALHTPGIAYAWHMGICLACAWHVPGIR
jgi:hypothetical protein